MINAKCAVTFVSFRDKIISVRLPVRIGTEDGDLGAHIMRRVQAHLPAERVRSSTEVVVLPCIPAMTIPFLICIMRGQCFRTPYHRKSQPNRFIKRGISDSDRRRIDYQFGAANRLLCLGKIKFQAQASPAVLFQAY